MPCPRPTAPRRSSQVAGWWVARYPRCIWLVSPEVDRIHMGDTSQIQGSNTVATRQMPGVTTGLRGRRVGSGTTERPRAPRRPGHRALVTETPEPVCAENSELRPSRLIWAPIRRVSSKSTNLSDEAEFQPHHSHRERRMPGLAEAAPVTVERRQTGLAASSAGRCSTIFSNGNTARFPELGL